MQMTEQEVPTLSRISVDPRLHLHQLKPTAAGILEKFYETVTTNAPLPNSSRSPIEIYVPGNSSQFLDLKHSFLYIEGRVKLADGSSLPGDVGSHCIPINLFPLTAFQQIEIYFNNVPVSVNTLNNSWVTLINSLLNTTETARSHQLKLSFFAPGDNTVEGYLNADDKDDLDGKWLAVNEEIRNRADKIAGSKAFEVMVPLNLLDHCNLPAYLPPNVSVLFRFHRYPTEFSLMSRQSKQFKFELLKFQLLVRRIVPNQITLESVMRSVHQRGATYPLIVRECRALTLPAGISTVDMSLLDGGILPQKVILFHLSENAFNGSLKLNPFALKHCEIESVQLKVAGQSLPPYAMRFEWDDHLFQSYLTILEYLDVDWIKDTIHLKFPDWVQSYPLIAFAIKPSSSEEAWEPQQEGSIRIECRYKKPLAESTKLMYIMLHEKVLALDAHGTPQYI